MAVFFIVKILILMLLYIISNNVMLREVFGVRDGEYINYNLFSLID